MRADKGEVMERMILELIMVSDIGLSPCVIERNWNVDESFSRQLLESLANKGYLEHIGDEVYVPTKKAYSLIDRTPLVRSSNDARHSVPNQT